MDHTGWWEYASRRQALEEKRSPCPGGPPPGDAATGFMNTPSLPVQDFVSFGDLDRRED